MCHDLIWKDVSGFNGLYEVSNFGTIRRKETKKTIKPALCKNGYYCVSLWKNNKGKTMYVHRIVAESFIENKNQKKCIDHINTNKKDNRVENLVWCSYKENMNNKITILNCSKSKIGKKQSEYTKKKRAKSLMKRVLCVEKNIIFNSIKEASDYFLIKPNTISEVLSGRNKTANGMHWRLLNV